MLKSEWEIGRELRERALESLARLYALGLEAEAGSVQLVPPELGVVRLILDEQDAQFACHPYCSCSHLLAIMLFAYSMLEA